MGRLIGIPPQNGVAQTGGKPTLPMHWIVLRTKTEPWAGIEMQT